VEGVVDPLRFEVTGTDVSNFPTGHVLFSR